MKKTAPRFLVVDVSNSFTKYALSTPARLGKIERRATARVDAAWLTALQRRYPGVPLFLSSVVPARTALFRRLFGAQLHRLHGRAKLGMKVAYGHPAQVGADRLANALAVRALFGAPAVVIDFGTAVTFDVVDAAGAYKGGVIAPGLRVMTDYLHERTALLPRVTVREPRQAIAQSTTEAIRAGAVIGYRGLIRGVLAAIKAELKLSARQRLHVVATGGDALFLTSTRHLPEIEAVRPALTLEGVRLWAVERFAMDSRKQAQ
jgi:type III pantothenate kinase